MPDFLLELFSEEIPARMQSRAADDLKKMVTDRLVEAGLVYEGAKAFATPRRSRLWCRAFLPGSRISKKKKRDRGSMLLMPQSRALSKARDSRRSPRPGSRRM